MNLAFYRGLRCFVESNVTERLSLSSSRPSSYENNKGWDCSQPSLQCCHKNFAEKRTPATYI